jgi:carbamoyl-phosphate synthase large subunit
MLSAMGLPVTMTTKKLSEGHPNVLDTITGGMVQGVINTVTSSGTVMRDGFAIRRTAAERRIPCFTSLDTARAAVDILVRDKSDYHVQPLASYRNRRQP